LPLDPRNASVLFTNHRPGRSTTGLISGDRDPELSAAAKIRDAGRAQAQTLTSRKTAAGMRPYLSKLPGEADENRKETCVLVAAK